VAGKEKVDMEFPSHEEGQGLAEYGWTLVLVAILVVILLSVFGLIVRGHWQIIADAWTNIWSNF
jgi:Flp pilus assembly pilin Flp